MEPARIESADPERSLLGAILIGSHVMPSVSGIVTPDSFSGRGHAEVYAAINALHRDGSPIDITTVVDELRRRDQLESVGGAYAVVSLTTGIASTINAEHHARIIAEKHALRLLEGAAKNIAYALNDGAADAFDVLGLARADLDAIAARLSFGSGVSTAAHEIGALADTAPMPPGYTTGVRALDDVLSLQPGLPYVFAGRPGIGKSILSCVIAWHMTMTGDAQLFSPEMTVRQVQARILAMESGVPYSVILGRKMDEQQVHNLTECIDRIGPRLSRLHIDVTSAITPDQVRARIDRAVKDLDLRGFVIDHLHKMSTGDRRVDKDETPRVSQCMEGITRICKDSGLYGVVMCQLNRQVEARTDRHPRLADLKQTGRIEEDAAGVVLLYREGYYQPTQPFDDTLELAIAKNRDGACDTVHVRCFPSLNRIA